MLLNCGALDYHSPSSRTPFWDFLCWMILNHIPSPQERHLLSRPLSLFAYMRRDGYKLVFFLSRHLMLPIMMVWGKPVKYPLYPRGYRLLFCKIDNSPTQEPITPTLFPPQGQRIQSIPLYSPTNSPGWPGGLPLGQADDMCHNNFPNNQGRYKTTS